MPAPRLLILPGDGIGPEVMAQVRRVIDWFAAKRGLAFEVDEDLVGGAAYDAHGTPLTDATMDKAQAADAVLLGAVGGPKYDALDFAVKPERALLRLRKEMDLFANLRPAQCFDALADFSSLKREVVAGLDIMIVRELTSGIYFGEPRGIVTEGNERVGINTQRYTESEIARVARAAFALARKRDRRVCSMEKANVMESGVLWREEVQWVHDNEYADVAPRFGVGHVVERAGRWIRHEGSGCGVDDDGVDGDTGPLETGAERVGGKIAGEDVADGERVGNEILRGRTGRIGRGGVASARGGHRGIGREGVDGHRIGGNGISGHRISGHRIGRDGIGRKGVGRKGVGSDRVSSDRIGSD